jgi:WD40 repeat protein/DNA-binding SARP family transcriptional activator
VPIVRVSVLGPLVVEDGRVSLSPRDRVVLTALAVHAGEVVSGERLADALWGEHVPTSWAKVVQGCIVRLRKALGPDAIDTDAHGYRLTVAPDDLDVGRFELALRRARELLVLGEPERVMFAADEALALWRGRPLLDAADWEPATIQAQRLEELRMEAEELRLDAALQAGRHTEVLAGARAGVEAAPTRERRWELLALAQYRSGRQADALRTLHSARRVLAEEVGVDPGPALLALERAVLEQDPGLTGPDAPPHVGSWCPWPGLLAYDVDDAEGFFGRASEVDSCLERLGTSGVLVVVGASGSGKSSLVRAGIVDRLQGNGRRVSIVVPGARPLDALTVLPSSGEPLVLVVDQCEELVTLCEDAAQRARFLDAVVSHVWRGPVVVTLRADRLAELSGHPGFAELIERGLFLLRPMDEANLRAAIEGPAARAGLLLEPGLVDLVVREIQAEPGALPLLSHALHETWAHREGRTLTVAGFRETGGIAGAVAQSAERVYASSPEHERSKLRELLVRLVVPSENGEPARVPLSRDVVAGDPDYERLVERLVAARLVTSDDQVVELAHEAVARAWPRLREWLDDDVDGIRVLRHLTTAAAGWEAMGRPSSELYRGPRLAQARAWRERSTGDLTAVEQAFLDASVEAEAAGLRDAQEQVRRERITNRRLRSLVVAAAVLTVVALIVSSVAFRERQRANDGADVAEARRIAAQALVARPHDRALLLAVEALRRWDSPETQGNLLSTIGRSPNLTRILGVPGDGPMFDLELSPDGPLAAVTDLSGSLTILDLERDADPSSFTVDDGRYVALAFGPLGAVAAGKETYDCTGFPCSDSEIDVYDADQPDRPPTVHRGAVGPAEDLAFSPRGDLLASVSSLATVDAPEHAITVWRVDQPRTPHLRLRFPNRRGDLDHRNLGRAWVAFSPDGSHLYASGGAEIVRFDLATGGVAREFAGRSGLALSPDGKVLALRGAEGLEIVDAATGAVTARLPSESADVQAATFMGDGRQLATASSDGSITLWDTTSPQVLQTFEGHSGEAVDVVHVEGSDRLYSIASDRAVFEWQVGGSPLARTIVEGSGFADHDGFVLASPTGDTVAVMHGALRRIDVASRKATGLQGSGEWTVLNSSGQLRPIWAAYTPDGRHVVGVFPYGSTRLWDVRTGEEVATQRSRDSENLGAVAVSPDTGAVLVADIDGRVVELDGRTLSPTGRSMDVDVVPVRIRASAGGTFAVVGSDRDERTRVVFGDLDTEEVTTRASVAGFAIGGSFSTDGTRYAFGTDQGNIGIIDVATGSVTGPSTAVHAAPVAEVTFSPDGETLASLGLDGELVLSDGATARPRAQSSPRGVEIGGAMTYLSDGESILIVFADGAVVEYDVDPTAWIDHACRVVGRDLTAAEWRDAFGSGERRRTCTAG